MELLERARALKEIGFFGPGLTESPEELCRMVEEDPPCDPDHAPATALLLAAERVLEIPAEAAMEPEDFEDLLARIQEFCGGVFTVSELRAVPMDGPGGEAAPPRFIRLRFKLDNKRYETDLACYDDMVDLGFLQEIEEHLAGSGEPRRLCPLVELMDDTARYVFIEPEKMEKAELEQIITSPDFEEELEEPED